MTCPTWYHTNSAGWCECHCGARLENSVMCKPDKKIPCKKLACCFGRVSINCPNLAGRVSINCPKFGTLYGVLF